MFLERRLRGVEEGGREVPGDRAADHHEGEVERVAHRRRGTADEPSGALHDLVGRFGQWSTGDRLDRRARRLRVEAPLRPAHAAAAAGFDDDVPDLAGIPGRAVEQVAVEDQTARHRSRHRDRAEVLMALGGTEPSFGQREHLGVEVAVHRQSGQLHEARPQRKVAPRHDARR